MHACEEELDDNKEEYHAWLNQQSGAAPRSAAAAASVAVAVPAAADESIGQYAIYECDTGAYRP